MRSAATVFLVGELRKHVRHVRDHVQLHGRLALAVLRPLDAPVRELAEHQQTRLRGVGELPGLDFLVGHKFDFASRQVALD